MSYKENFNAFVGGKSGVFKGIKLDKRKDIIKNIQDLISITENDGITTVSWADNEEKEVLIACGVKGDRRVKVYDSQSSAFACSFLCNVGEGPINGISRYDGSILTAVQSGQISLWRFNGKEETLINAGENLNKMRHSRVQRNVVATAGLEHRLKLFDLERKAVIFCEKDVPHDWLELRVPISTSDIEFLSEFQQIATVSRYGYVRLYDPRAQRRPVINITMRDEALTCLGTTSKERCIIVGSGKGNMNLVDFRKSGMVLNTYKGFAGSVTGLACSSSNPLVASVSLDRYLRVHHIETKELLKKIYLTSKLTCLVTRSDFSIEGRVDNDKKVVTESHCDNDAVSEAEYDQLFNNMQVVKNKNEKPYKKRKHIESTRENSPISCDVIICRDTQNKRRGNCKKALVRTEIS